MNHRQDSIHKLRNLAKAKAKKELRKATKELEKMPKRGRPSKRKREILELVFSMEVQNAARQTRTLGRTATEVGYNSAKQELKKMKKHRGHKSNREKSLLAIIAMHDGESCAEAGMTQSQAEETLILHELAQKVETLKRSKNALGMNPEKEKIELDKWIKDAKECGLELFVELGKKVEKNKEAILATIKLTPEEI